VDFAGLDDPARFQHRWNKWLEISKTIRHRRHDNDADVVTSEILLILKILVGGEEDVEVSGSDRQ
jgi:hypothetical protein